MTAPFVSIHGRRLGLAPNGLVMDGRLVGGATPTGFGRGKTWYVDSNIAGADGTSPDTALATINAAVAKATANVGDVIVVLPKHAETITAAGGVTVSVAGVSIIGLGHYGQRPTFTFTTANTATFKVTAADVYINGLSFLANFLNVATAIDSTAKGLFVDNCMFDDTDSTHNLVAAVTASGAANTSDGLRVENCRFRPTATGSAGMIKLVDTVNNLRVLDNIMVSAGTGGTAFACSNLINSSTGKLITNGNIGRNKVVNAMTAGELLLSTDGTTNTGIVYDNYVGHADVTGAHDLGVDGAGFRLFNNLSTSVDNLSGLVVPAADVNL